MIDNAIALIYGVNNVETGIMIALSNGMMMSVLERIIGMCEERIDESDNGSFVLVAHCPLFRVSITSDNVILQDGDTRFVVSWDADDISDSDAFGQEVCRLMNEWIIWRYRDVLK